MSEREVQRLREDRHPEKEAETQRGTETWEVTENQRWGQKPRQEDRDSGWGGSRNTGGEGQSHRVKGGTELGQGQR